MPRTATLTFDDGTTHTYTGVPDNATPDDVEARAARDFVGRRVMQIQGNRADLIPGVAPGTQIPAATSSPAPQAPASVMDRLKGTGEAALTLATGATGGALGTAGGFIGGLAGSVMNGDFGTQQGADNVERAMSEGAAALTYQPRTAEGQRQTAAAGEVLQQLVPMMGLTGEMAMAGRAAATASQAARTAAPVIARAGAAVAREKLAPVVQAAQERIASVTGADPAPTPGTFGSMGAAGTDVATQRRTTAADLGFSGDAALTKGQATRDAAQLKFEAETAKLPGPGTPLRQRLIAQNNQILNNFDGWIDQTGAQAPSLRAVGAAVDQALVKQAAADKARVRTAYNAANASEEARAMVDPGKVVSIGEGEQALTSSPIDYLNSKPAGLNSTKLVDDARAYALKLGIAEKGADGQLIPRPATIRDMEAWRREISGATGYEPSDIQASTVLKKLIDAQTEPVAGPLYRNARRMRERFAQNYENRATIAKLLTEKRGTADRAVALEDVFQHSILKASLDDVRNVRRVLQRGGEEGQQAWRELQGATMRHIRDEATKSVALDSRGNRVVSPAALDRIVNELDADGRLDFVFGKQGAQRVRDIRELAQIMKTVPPESAVNTSNTVSALLAAFGDVGASSLTGAPIPVATVTRMVRQYVKDRALRRRIEDALNEQAIRQRLPNNKRNAPQVTEPQRNETLH